MTLRDFSFYVTPIKNFFVIEKLKKAATLSVYKAKSI